MGSKVNPRSFRQATMFKTPSRWFASKDNFAQNLQVDVQVRKMIRQQFKDGGVARVEIERALEEITIIIFTSKPGMVIGRGGSLITELKNKIKHNFFGSTKMKVNVNIQEVEEADMNAELVCQAIRDQLEQRVPFRRAIKRAMESVMRAQAKGCKIRVSGRLNGAEIARTETITQGRLPLHTLRANIDYSRSIAQTVYGVIGIKVWIYKGDVFGDEEETVPKKEKSKRHSQPHRKRKKLKTGGKKLILRKKSEVDKEKDSSVKGGATAGDKKFQQIEE